MFVSLSKTRLLLLPCLIAAAISPVAHAQNPLPQTPQPQSPQTPQRPRRTPRTPNPTPDPQAPVPDPQGPAPTPTPTPAPGPQAPVPGQPGGGGGFGGRFGGGGQFGGAAQARTTPRPYKDVITAEAKSDPGIFMVHRIDDRILFEIPAKQLGKEMLLSTEIEKVPAGSNGYGGTAAGDKVVRFTRRNNTVFLRTVDYSSRAEGKGAIARAVEAANVEPIVMAFPVEAEGADKSAVIDVTRLFTTDPAEFSVKQQLGGSAVDPTRSFIEKSKAFPTNIEVKSNLTFAGGAAGGLGGVPGAPAGGRRRGGGANSLTALVHYSLVLLPEKPMMPRLFDSRVGYFTERFEDYGTRRKPRGRPPVHRALPAGEERPDCRAFRTRQADRLLHQPRSARRSGIRT